MRPVAVIEECLLRRVLLAVVVGLLVPEVAVLTRFSTALLAIMIGSVSLTLSLDSFRGVDPTLAVVSLGRVLMPGLAFVVAASLGLSEPFLVGSVVLGAVTPELVSSTVTELAGGDTAPATTALVVAGLTSVGFIPAVAAVLFGGVDVPTAPVVRGLATAVVAPMVVAARAWRPDRAGRYDGSYPAVSAVMVASVIGGVTAANAGLLRANGSLVVGVLLAAAVLNVAGYGLWFLLTRGRSRSARIAGTFSVGTRDFAVAAGFPTVASLPSVRFGVIEMTASTG